MKVARYLGVMLAAVVLATCANRPGIQGGASPLFAAGTTIKPPTRCVRIYYDRSATGDPHGRAQAMFLQNLLGHFSHVRQVVSPVEAYRKGDLEAPVAGFDRCAAAFYQGTFYDNAVPRDFIDDFAATKVPVAWLGYNIWKVDATALASLWNVAFGGILRADKQSPDADGVPGFYRRFLYKGETFLKAVHFDPKSGAFDAADELMAMRPLTGKSGASTDANVVAWAEHTAKTAPPARLPYVLHRGNHWYVADAPFNYVHSADRYLIVADVLFDVLGEPPLYPGARPALIRYEDLHATLPQWQLDALVGLAKKKSLPFAMSIIPEYVDARPKATGGQTIRVKMTERPDFPAWAAAATAAGGSLLMHGWTHQHDDLPNPLGVSGWDYEMWDYSTNRPLPEDAILMTLERLENGYALFEANGLKPCAWLTPHYAASALDNFVFGQAFDWAIGGQLLAPFTATGELLPEKANFDVGAGPARPIRKKTFAQERFQLLAGAREEGFITPYEIYGDVFGQGVVPETAGYLNPNPADKNLVDDMLRKLKRNRVLRDAWGSFFIHPFMLNIPAGGGIGAFQGDTAELERLIDGVRALGYEFVDLKGWLKEHGAFKRAPTIELAPGPSGFAAPTERQRLWDPRHTFRNFAPGVGPDHQ